MIIDKINYIHSILLDKFLTIDFIKDQRQKRLFDIDNLTILSIIKSTYQLFYYTLNNAYVYFTYKNFLTDSKFVNELLSKQNLDMNELRNKTNKALDNNDKQYPNLYMSITKWIAGNCWSNSLITNGYGSELFDIDKEIIFSINKSIELVEPIENQLVLFHGFEKFTDYKEDLFEVDKIFTFQGILSKSSYFEISRQFAQSENYFQPKYIIVLYPKGSKHIGINIKPIKYDEYEYISKSGECLKLIRICKVFYGLQQQIFYIFESQDY